jgi:hypothetical protein
MRAYLLFAWVVLCCPGCILPAQRTALPADSGVDAIADADSGAASDATGDGDGDGPSDGGPTVESVRQGCVLLMHMDEPAWSGVPGEVIDDSGFGNNGTASGDATTVADGWFGRAGSFGGTGAVIVPSSPSLQPTTALTISFWIYATGLDPSGGAFTTTQQGIIAKRTADGMNSAFAMFLWTNNEIYVDINGATDRFHIDAGFSNNSWYQWTVVFDGTQSFVNLRVHVYTAGIPYEYERETSSSIAPSSADLSIGVLPGGQNFVGLIDELAIWTRALDPSEAEFLASHHL